MRWADSGAWSENLFAELSLESSVVTRERVRCPRFIIQIEIAARLNKVSFDECPAEVLPSDVVSSGPVGLHDACHGINLYSGPVRPQSIHGNEETFMVSSAL
jgi:hypothetical protein